VEEVTTSVSRKIMECVVRN